jgi:c-di-GMP-binding flagellar brake protein YcgR
MATNEILVLDEKNQIDIAFGNKLFIEMKTVKCSINSFFVGMIANKYIIITPPSPMQKIKHKLFKDNALIIKYLYKGTIYAFQTKIIDFVNDPVKLLVLQYPKFVQNRELRSRKRVICAIPVTAIDKKNKTDITAVIKDISTKGCCFIFNAKNYSNNFNKNQKIKLFIKFPGIDGKKEFLGEIKNISKIQNEIDIGVKFIDITEKMKNYITQYIVSISIV